MTNQERRKRKYKRRDKKNAYDKETRRLYQRNNERKFRTKVRNMMAAGEYDLLPIKLDEVYEFWWNVY